MSNHASRRASARSAQAKRVSREESAEVEDIGGSGLKPQHEIFVDGQTFAARSERWIKEADHEHRVENPCACRGRR